MSGGRCLGKNSRSEDGRSPHIVIPARNDQPQHAKCGRSFTLPSFGTFRVAKTKARMGLNPATREPLKIKAAKTVRFKASKVLRDAV